jgi:hypothetical protein
MQWSQRPRNGSARSSRLSRLFLTGVGILAVNGAAIVAVAQVAPSPAGAQPSVFCTWTDAAASGLVSVADNWSPTSSCGGTSTSAASATLTGAQLIFPATIPSGGGTPVLDETLSIDSIVLDNSYALTTPATTGSETLTLTPTSTPTLGIAETAGNSSIVPSTTTLTIDLGNAQEWAIATGSSLSEAAPFSGSSALVFGDTTNSGEVVLPSASPSFGGQITIDGSSVEVESGGAFNDAPVTMSGSAPQLSIHNTGSAIAFPDSITFASGNPLVTDDGGDSLSGTLDLATDTIATLDDASATVSFTISASVTGGAATLKTESAGGLVVLDGPDTLLDLPPCSVWAASGPTQLAIASAFPSGCGLQVSLGATFDLHGNSIVTGTGSVSGLAGDGTITNDGSTPATLTDSGTTDSFAGGLSNGTGTLALAVSGTGSSLQLSGTDSYSGGTTVGGGATLGGGGLASADPFGSGAVAVDNGGTLTLNSAFGDGVLDNPLALGNGTAGTSALDDAEGTGAAYWSGALALNGTNTVSANSTGNLVLDGGIAGSGQALTVGWAGNAGDVTLSPSPCSGDSYSGGTTVNVGSLVLSCTNAAGSAATETVTVAGGATLEYQFLTSGRTVPNNVALSGTLLDDTPGTTTSSGTFTLGGSASVVASSLAGGVDFTNTISGSGTLLFGQATPYLDVLSGTNTYSGAVAVQGGTLDVTGSLAAATITVDSDAILEGSGTVGGVTANQGMVAPGTSTSPGVLDATSPVDLGPAGGAFSVIINGTSAGSGYSQLSSTSTVNLDGASLDVTDATNVPYGTMFTVVDSSAAGSPVSGTFASLPAGALLTTEGGRTLKIGYTANAVTLTDVTGAAPTGSVPVNGYQLAGSDGAVYAFGAAPYEGSLPGDGIRVSNITAMTSTNDGKGYWLVGSDGGVFAFGDAAYEGSLPADGVHVSDIVSIRVTNDGEGYWLVGSDGGVFAFGDARYEGSLPADGVRVSDIVGMRKSADDGGYQLVGSDGGVFAFGDASFEGSLPAEGIHVSDIVGMENVQDGYFLVGADGGVFAFGQAAYQGSLPADGVHVSDIVGIATGSSGLGYALVGADGGVFTFGDIAYSGSLPAMGVSVHDIVGIHDTTSDT